MREGRRMFSCGAELLAREQALLTGMIRDRLPGATG